jgi:hypothetical protein
MASDMNELDSSPVLVVNAAVVLEWVAAEACVVDRRATEAACAVAKEKAVDRAVVAVPMEAAAKGAKVMERCAEAIAPVHPKACAVKAKG